MWNTAENALREVLNELGLEYTEEIGEAAFYGPKLDVNVKPAIGAEYTLSTCQLDFCLPAKFNLVYIDKDNQERTPVVLHRAILGSLDRSALEDAGIRTELDRRGEKIGYKIREAQQQKVPYMVIVGQKEAESGTLSIRNRAGEETHDVSEDAFIAQLKEEIRAKSR